MIINLSPQRRDDRLTLSLAGEVLAINGDPLDLSVIPDGASLPAEAVDCPFINGPIERIAGEVHMSLILPFGPRAPEETRFANLSPLVVDADGPVTLPPWGTDDEG